MKVFLLVYVLKLSSVREADNVRIVEPFPENISAIESSAAQVTCVASGSSGETTPQKIEFLRRNDSNREHELKASKSLYFTNRTQKHNEETKLFVTLHFRRLTIDDDSNDGALGNYECQAFAKGDVKFTDRLGFSVAVIQSKFYF